MLDWDDLRFVLAVARGGTLSAAARALAVTQPTVGRRIDAFERVAGARLFQRGPSGYALTAAGRAVIGYAERIEREVLAVERAITGRDAGLQGSVRITAPEWLVVHVLGPALAGLLERHTGLAIDLIADPRRLNLARREADIALRSRAFEQQAVHQRKLVRVELALYASPEYLAARGAPTLDNGCAGHTILVMREDIGDSASAWLSSAAASAHVAVRTNGREAMLTMAAAGIGMACLPRILGDAHAGVRRIAVQRPPPERGLWLGVHRDARKIPRVRAVIAFLTDELQRLQPAFAPGA